MSPARIRALPQVVADAIAAGEVVERPASVVKELCENALDAGARRIDVDIEGGGLVRIVVRDDGAGIEAEDLPLAVARHATSKIGSAADLAGIATLGFRGEALASIAAVADVRIVSRTTTAAAATRLHVRAGTVLRSGAAAAAPGTSVEVADLFAATPARLAFLRTPRAESAAAVRAVADLALLHPAVAVTCRTDGRLALRSPGGALGDAARAVLGAAAGALLEVEAAGDIPVGGAISPPHLHRAARNGLVIGVNGRRIHNRALLVAAEEAYRALIPAGRHPFGVLTIGIAGEGLDVNVHPAKREVRFRDERAVFSAVQRACWATLSGAAGPSAGLAAAMGESVPPRPALPALADRAGSVRGYRAGAGDRPGASLVSAALSLQRPDSLPAPIGTEPAGPLRGLGQVGTEWLVAAAGGDLILVDPHAAHEKILYGELIARWSGADDHPRSQILLIPATVEGDPVRMERLEAVMPLLRACGFDAEVFGPELIRCTAVPAGSQHADIAAMVADLLDVVGDEAEDDREGERRHRVAATVACHSAVRFGDPLAPEEQQRLLDRLALTPGAATCPHGRPTTLRLERSVLRRAFGRPGR